MQLPKSVTIGECVVRDGFQNEEMFVPTDAKLYLLEAFADAGFEVMEATSFANPRYVPQFRDAEEVLRRLKRKPGAIYKAITVTQKGVESAIRAKEKGYGVDRVVSMISASESHSLRNAGQTPAELFAVLPQWIKLAHDAGMTFEGCVGTFLGCAIEGPVPMERSLEFAERFIDAGVDSVMYGDTTGEGTPDRVHEFFSRIVDKFPNMLHLAHFHDSRGFGLANCWAALSAGVTHFDSSMGGLGGQPANMLDRVPVPGTGIRYTPSEITGNVCTEDLVVMLDSMGVDTGLDVDKVLDIGRLLERILGRRLRSCCVQSGRIPKGPTGR